MLRYPQYAQELTDLLQQDQNEWRSFWRSFNNKQNEPSFKIEFERVRRAQHARTERMLEILDDIEAPSLTNIGAQAAQAVSVLALHDSLPVLKQVLQSFEQCYARDASDTYMQAIPSMTDRRLLLERKPQMFGTQWEGDGSGIPFLPTVADFERVNERRATYGIEPLRWPKSLAIPEIEQPWLKSPLSELVMRDLTDDEFEKGYSSYLI